MVSANSAAETAGEATSRGFAAAQDYAGKGFELAENLSEGLRQFVRREPWIALAAAFAIGYTMARVMRRVTSYA